jgi:uncharacterized protein (TIGR02284 family)
VVHVDRDGVPVTKGELSNHGDLLSSALRAVDLSVAATVGKAPQKEIAMSTEGTISTLNSLTKTTLDSMKGFKDAAQDAESTQFSTMFADFARERSEVATALQAEVRRLGGNPEDDSSFLAAAHRTFMDLKAAFTGKDDKAIIQEVERGEDYIKGKFMAALNNDDLDPSSREVVERAFHSVKAGHDRASALKHSMM